MNEVLNIFNNSGMKNWFFMLCIPVMILAQEGNLGQKLTWFENYDTALVHASENKTNVLLYFTGSDWCAPCARLKKDLFETKEFQNIAEHYVLLYVDIPRNKDLLSPDQADHNYQVLSKYNTKGVFPLFVILDRRGKVLETYSGYSMNGDVQYHLALFEKHKR